MARSIKRANKKSTRGVKRMWKKGQSASFNPTFNKFRLEAKKRGMFCNTGTSNLTEARLAQHSKLSCDDAIDDAMSIGGDTAVSAFTNCDLPTFNRLINNWNAGSILHKEMIAVLAAVSDVLKTNGGKETETEYFAALMTTLDVVDTDEGVTAVICLLSMVVKKLNETILKHESDTALEKFIKLLIKYMNSDHGALLRNLMKLVYAFLKVKNNWSDFCCENLKILLEFVVHHKPKVRRAAHQIIRTLIVDGCQKSVALHPGCAIVTEFCISKLKKGGGPTASKDVFYVLSLLEETLGVFPKSNIKSLSETILSVMTLSNSLLTSACLKTLKGLFSMKPKQDSVSSDLNARIIAALYEYQPNVKETSSLINWLQLMEAAFINLKQLDEKLCVGHLPKFYGKAAKCWQNEREEVLETVMSILKNLLSECIRPFGEVFQQYLLDDSVHNPMNKMFHHVEECLGYQYHKAWKYILIVLSTFFEVIGKYCYPVMLKCLRSLADMHDTHKFPYISELEKAVGTAVTHMGPKIVLEAIPLQLNGNSDKPDFPRSWLLPVLRDYIKRTELMFFVKYFMPLAAKLRNKALTLQQEQKIVESKLFDLLCTQIWSLLPGFCNEPTDLKQCFKEVARTLGMLLNEEPSIRMHVLSALRVLITKNLENDENRMELARFSKNYLPILFNLYSTETKDKNEERVRLVVYETCKAFLQITEKELCKTYFEKAIDKLMSSDASDFMQQCMIDICRAILQYVGVPEIQKIYEYCKPLLKDSNHTTQKKSYSVLNELCSSDSKSCKLFVKDHLEDIRPILCGSAAGLKPSTRALRLNILAQIAKHLSETEKEFVKSIIPEAVLCTKEHSVKARAAAFNLLVTVGNILVEWKPKDPTGAFNEYLHVLLAGLAGSPHLVSATILAIGRVLYDFKDKMDSNLITLIVENICLLLTSKSREVIVSAISFLKILFSVMDTADLAEHVEAIVRSITNISKDNQRAFRFKAKEFLTRLIRKFGYEMIAKLVPEDYQKQISHIRKMEARKSRKKDIDIEDEDEEEPSVKKTSEGFDAILADSDEEMPLGTGSERPIKMAKKKKTVETFIEEHEDDIIDLMDPSINKRLLTKIPEKVTAVKKTQKEFPVSEDGRLIITEESDESKSKQDSEMAERREILAELGAFKSKKRKNQDIVDDEDDNFDDKPVMKGIHRSLETKNKKTPGVDFKAKKAGGDVKKGKYDPFAYIPFNKQMLNKRKQVKMKGQFKNLVKGAKKGASIGVKRKMKDARKKKNKN